MKLLDILAKEMKEWPEGMSYAVQDYDGEVKFGSKSSECHAFIDGGVWHRNNDEHKVTRLFIKVSCDYKTSKVTKEQWRDAKELLTKELLTKQHTSQPKHKHAEMIALCAEFAQTMENPMLMFQFKDCGVWVDIDIDSAIAFYNHREYRLKPKTHTVNGVEIPDLRFDPKNGEGYHVPDPLITQLYLIADPTSQAHSHRKDNNLCYENTEAGKQAAILHAKAWLGIA